eukprot:981957-Amphidinium_carterae.1
MFKCFNVVRRCEVDPHARVFGHTWVEGIRHGVPKSRLTLQDFRHQAKQKENRVKLDGAWDSNSVETVQSPTPSNMVNKMLMWAASFYHHAVISIDVVSAFPHAEERGENVLMEPPVEWLNEKGYQRGEVVWEMTGNLYGRRAAPANFREHLEGIILSMPEASFRRGTIEPCLYFSASLNIRLTHHVDDIRAVGPSASLRKFVDYASQYLLLKVSAELTTGTVHDLGRWWGRLERGWLVFPNEKHITKVSEELGFGQGGRAMPKPAATPGVEVSSLADPDWTPLTPVEVSQFRSLVAHLCVS